MPQPDKTTRLALYDHETGTAHSDTASMADITHCVICSRTLNPRRTMPDTCGDRCYRRLLTLQRAHNAIPLASPAIPDALRCECCEDAAAGGDPCDAHLEHTGPDASSGHGREPSDTTDRLPPRGD